MRGRILSLIRMSSTKVIEETVRSKPFIVICGCTGTGKTKLSIQLAEWLIKSGKKSEIINADAMQVDKIQFYIVSLFFNIFILSYSCIKI